MGSLIISIFTHSFKDVIGESVLQLAYVFADFLSNMVLQLFDFESIDSIVVNLPGLEGADIALSYMAFGIAIILFAVGIYQYFLSPQGSRDSVPMQIGRIVIVCYFIGNATLVIEKVLNISYKIFILAKDKNGDVAQLKGDTFNQLLDAFESGERSLVHEGFNAILDWNSVSFVLEGVFLLVILWNVFKLWLKMFERYVNFIVELYLFPVTVSFMANASMQDVFFTYLRALMSQYIILLLNIFFTKVALLNIVNGFLVALLSENNIYTLFLFSLAFVKIALKMEELIHTWGLFGMSAGSVLDDAREVLQVMRDGAIFTGGAFGGKGSVGGGNSFLEHAKNAFGGKKASFGDGIGSLASGIYGMGKGIQNGKGIGGKVGGAVNGFIKGVTPKGTSETKKQIGKYLENRNERKKYGKAAYDSALRSGMPKKDAKISKNQVMNDMKPKENSRMAAEIKKKPGIANQSISSYAGAMCKGPVKKMVSKASLSKAAAEQKNSLTRRLNTAQAHSLVGPKTISDTEGIGLGKCVGGEYNHATGTASLNFEKINKNGEKEYTKATAVPFNDTRDGKGYAPQILEAANGSGIQYTESISEDGQRWAIIQDQNMPSEISGEMENRSSAWDLKINTDLENAESIIRNNNENAVKGIIDTDPERFIKANEDGSKIEYSGENDETSKEAFQDWLSAYNMQGADLDEGAGNAFRQLNDDLKKKVIEYWNPTTFK